MKLKYYYSACVSIITPDVSILCDPWFTDGAYDGAWYQFPKFQRAIDRIDRYDLVYISHIHPDHYDPIFLKEYLKRHPDTRIVAQEKFLLNAMRREGFPIYQGEYKFGETEFEIFFNDTSSVNDIDTALVVKWRDQSIVNMNDNMPNEEQLKAIKEYAPNPSVALLGYSGAGPYPQTYYTNHEKLTGLAEKKKQELFDRYKELDSALNANINIPFAGQYLLGGKLARLNKYRGVPDAVEVYEFDDKAIVLKECGELTIGQDCSSIRTEPYKGVEAYINEITDNKLDYELLNIPLNKIPFERLLRKAYDRAMKANEYRGDNYYIAIKLLKGYYLCNINSYAEKAFYSDTLIVEPNLIIELDLRYLFGLITGIYHWNNAIVGSHLRVTRSPDIFNRNVNNFLNFFYV